MSEEEKRGENMEETVSAVELGKDTEDLAGNMENTMDKAIPYDLYNINLDDLVENFLFPKQYQHPLSSARMIIFGMHGPLDEEGRLRAGYRGNRVVLDYELEAMCDQVERDDVTSIYLHTVI